MLNVRPEAIQNIVRIHSKDGMFYSVPSATARCLCVRLCTIFSHIIFVFIGKRERNEKKKKLKSRES